MINTRELLKVMHKVHKAAHCSRISSESALSESVLVSASCGLSKSNAGKIVASGSKRKVDMNVEKGMKK